jgi:hypothetical protein
MVKGIRDSLNITNVLIEDRDQDWLDARFEGRVVE